MTPQAMLRKLGSLVTIASAFAAVSLTINGQPATIGNITWSPTTTIVADNGLIAYHFGARGNSINLLQAIVNGVQIANNGASDWYVDWSGGSNGQVASWNIIQVIRVTPDLVEWAFTDTQHATLQHDLHMIMTTDVRGVYMFNIMRAVSATSISEVRFNTRWDRCTLNQVFNFERGAGRQPMYAFLETAADGFKIQDETWRLLVSKPDASLPCPADNNGLLPQGTVYTKYEWSLYHHENPYFGHFGAAAGNFIGTWLTPLGGITNATSAASYGVGPQHDDLAVHQDDLILNYMGANHYGLPSYPIARGYTRLYGPWLMHVSVGTSQADMLAEATAVAEANIAQSYVGLPVISNPLYPTARGNVSGSVVISDGRSANNLWVILSIEVATDVYELHENTYFVLTEADGSFTIPGVPPGSYALYIQGGGAGTVFDVFRRTNVAVAAGSNVLGVITWTPSDATHTHLWAIGGVDRSGGEFALGRAPRDWYLPGAVPGSLTFTVGSSHEPSDWYYAQTQGGTWTVKFTLPDVVSGVANLIVSASLTQGNSPSVSINGISPSGHAPSGSDSTLSRQAVRSGYPKLSILTFPASTLVAGVNTLTFTRGTASGSNNTGMGYDAVILNVDTGAHPAGAVSLSVSATRVSSGPDNSSVWRITVDNTGNAAAMLPRVELFEFVTRDAGNVVSQSTNSDQRHVRPSFVDGRDPHIFPLPIAPFVAARGDSQSVDLRVGPLPPNTLAFDTARIHVRVSANGGRSILDTIVKVAI